MYGCWGEGSGLEELTFPVDVRPVALDLGQSQASHSYPWRGGCMGVGGRGPVLRNSPFLWM